MRLKWKIKMSAIVIIALAIVFLAYSRSDAFKMASAEENVIVEEKKVEEKPKLKGWGDKLFKALDGEIDKTKEYQKKQWEKTKKQFKDLFNIFNKNDKSWEELDKEIKEEKDETKEEK